MTKSRKKKEKFPRGHHPNTTLTQRFLTLESLLLGFEVDNFMKFFIKTSNAVEFIESDIQIIEAPRIDDPIV